MQIEIKGDTAVLKGAVEDQSIFEKAVVAVGNTLGISRVETSDLKVVLPGSGMKLDAAADMKRDHRGRNAGQRTEIPHGGKGRHALGDRRESLW